MAQLAHNAWAELLQSRDTQVRSFRCPSSNSSQTWKQPDHLLRGHHEDGRSFKWTPRTGAQLRTPNSLYQPCLRTSSLSQCFVWVWILTAAGEPWPLRRGSVVVAGPVYTLDALVPIDDLEDLTDECTGLLSSILVQGRKRAQLLPTIRAALLPQRQCEPALRHSTSDSLK